VADGSLIAAGEDRRQADPVSRYAGMPNGVRTPVQSMDAASGEAAADCGV